MIDFSDLRLSERLRELDARTWMNENPAAVSIGASVLLVIALGILIFSMFGGGSAAPPAPTQKFFYDLNTGELFAVDLDELPPIERGQPYTLPGGTEIPAGVEAIVRAPEGADEDEYVVAWVETLRPELRERLRQVQREAQANPDGEQAFAYDMMLDESYGQRLIMDPKRDDRRFFPVYSDPAQQIMSQTLRDADGQPLRPVYP
jgi:hypothetical protein